MQLKPFPLAFSASPTANSFASAMLDGTGDSISSDGTYLTSLLTKLTRPKILMPLALLPQPPPQPELGRFCSFS